jgi:hypothetical protein
LIIGKEVNAGSVYFVFKVKTNYCNNQVAGLRS